MNSNPDDRSAVQPPRLERVLLFWTLMLIALTVGWLAYGRFNVISAKMISLGWEPFLFQKKFMPGCLFHTGCREKLWLGITVGVPQWVPFVPFALLVLAGLFKPRAEVRRKSPGQASWADRKSLGVYLQGETKVDPSNPRRGYSGVFVDRKGAHILRPPLRVKCGHSWVVAGTGGGKSSRYLKVVHAFAAFEGSSCITIDLKYPDLESGLLDCALPYAKEGHPVQVFTPYEPKTLRLDLFSYASSLDDANLLAEAFVPEGNEMTEFYRAQARTLLKAMFYAAANAQHRPTPKELYLMVKAGPGAVQEFLMQESPEAFLEAKMFFMNKPDAQIAMFANLGRELELFSNEHVSRAFSYQKGEMIDPTQPLREVGMLYIGITLYEVQSVAGKRLIQILVRLLHATIDKTARAHRNRLPVHVNFNLDEFGNMPPLPYIGERFATMRSYGVCYNISLQNITQGEAVYGRLEFKAGTDNNITHRLYIPASLKDLYVRETLSKEIGRASYQDTSHNDSSGGGFLSFAEARRGETRRDVAVDLVSPAEMLSWAANAGILFVASGPQAKVALPRMDEKRFLWQGRWVKNPIYFLHRRYFAGVNLEDFALKIASVALPSAAGQVAPSLPHPVVAFTLWLETLLEAEVTVFFYEGERERIFVRSEELEMYPPEERFFKLEWIKTENGKVLLTDIGRKLVGADLRAKLRVQKYLTQIRQYLTEHRDEVAGMGGQALEKPRAIYQDQALLVSSNDLRSIFGHQVPTLDKVKRDGQRFFILPLDPTLLLAAMAPENRSKTSPEDRSDEESTEGSAETQNARADKSTKPKKPRKAPARVQPETRQADNNPQGARETRRPLEEDQTNLFEPMDDPNLSNLDLSTQEEEAPSHWAQGLPPGLGEP